MKKNHFFKNLLTIAVMFLFSASVCAQYSGKFVRITSLSDLTDGYYVITGNETDYAMKVNIDGSSQYAQTVAITNDTIANTDETIVW
ncbi:MAG: hypothetical protein LBT04_03955, partial [Prevotellaceae bacterium]|nr:hypothetical protein [Prevotellaceae bacterium]